MRRGGLTAFFAMTFAFTWGLGALYALYPSQSIAVLGPISFQYSVLVSAVSAPTLAALVIALFQGRASLRDLVSRLFRWNIGLFWYVAPVVAIASLGLGAQFLAAYLHGMPAPAIPSTGAWPQVLQLGAFAFVLDPGPLGEELGWRGFALPRLLGRFTALTAALILGGVWGVWHLPAFLIAAMPQSHLGLVQFLVAIMSTSVLMTWVANKTRGSVIPAILIHWSFNRFVDLTPAAASISALVFMTAAILLVLMSGTHLGVSPALEE